MPNAYQIECVTKTPDGEIAALAGRDGEGRAWRLSRSELMREIAAGRITCYVAFEDHAHLVTLNRETGGKRLVTFLGDLELLPLRECR
jgi:hypothetical protein